MRATNDSNALLQFQRSTDSEALRSADLARQLSSAQAALTAAQSDAAECAERETALRLELTNLRSSERLAQKSANDAARKLASLQSQHDDLLQKSDEQRREFSQTVAHSQFQESKLHSVEHEVQLLQGRLAEVQQSAETAAAQTSAREAEHTRRARESDKETQEQRREWESTRQGLEAQLASIAATLADEKAAARKQRA